MTTRIPLAADPEAVAQVRRTNRLVTERIGALEEGYLARGRSLGASRLLWEIGRLSEGRPDVGPDVGEDLRALRERLALDSGYVSRLLRSLEAEGLVTVRRSQADRRVRVARLTEAGRQERRVLDERSDDLATALLEPLTAGQRARLVAAMAEVERLLTASAVEVREVDAWMPDAQRCLQAYFTELDRRFPSGYDPARGAADPEEMRRPAGVFLVAYLHSEAIACGGVRFHQNRVAELKRMWVASERRGLGLGRRMLAELTARARDQGAAVVRLQTHQSLVEAITMYESEGFERVTAFNQDEPDATDWFQQRL